MQQYIGVDIGGSHITAALVNLTLGKVEKQSLQRLAVNPHASADEVLTVWAKAIASVTQSLPDCHIGIAMPGPFDYENGICLMKYVNKYDHLYGLNIKKELALRLDILPSQISFRNDAEAFLEGEMLFGAGKGFDKGLGITLGTGLGTSLFIDGQAKDLALGINHPLHKGVAEDYLSTRWFISYYQTLTNKTIPHVKDLASRYPYDKLAQQVFEEFAYNLGLVLSNFIATYQPEVIVLGGNITQAADLFFPQLKKQFASYSPSVAFKISTLHEFAGMIGAVGFELAKLPFVPATKH